MNGEEKLEELKQQFDREGSKFLRVAEEFGCLSSKGINEVTLGCLRRMLNIAEQAEPLQPEPPEYIKL